MRSARLRARRGAGRVARIVVNPTSMPERPAACDAGPSAKAAPKLDRGATKAKSR